MMYGQKKLNQEHYVR